MAKQKNKDPDIKLPSINVSNNRWQYLPPALADVECTDFDCSGNFLTNLSFAPKKITGNLICKNNKKVTGELNPLNQFHLGAGRFDVYEGSEDIEINRPVYVGDSFITDVETYKDPKIYDCTVGVPSKNTNEEIDTDDGALNDDKNLVKIKYKIDNDNWTIILALNIQQPKFGFEFKNIPDFESRGQRGYGSWGNNQPVHGFFVQRLGLNGPHKKGKKIEYGGGPPPGGYKGWGDPPFNFKNYINWGFFEDQFGSGAGSESKYKWGSCQLNGATVLDGKQYGAKTNSHSFRPTYYYLKGDSKMYRAKSGEIFRSMEGQTISIVNKASFFEDISIAITGAKTIIENNNIVISSGLPSRHPFFGKLNDGTYFAGLGTNMIVTAQKILEYFKKQGKQVEWMDCGDGGGSAQIAKNGKMIEDANERDNRPVASIIGW